MVINGVLVDDVIVNNVLVETCESCGDAFACKLEDLPPAVNGVDPKTHCRECYEEKAFGILSSHELPRLHLNGGRTCPQVVSDADYHGKTLYAELARTIADRL